MLSIARYLKHYVLYLRRGRFRDAHHLARIMQSEYLDPAYYLEHNRDVAAAGYDPAMHYLDYGAGENRNPSELFDTNYYVANNVDVTADGLNPLLHFLRHGRRIGRQPRLRVTLQMSKSAGRKRGTHARPVSQYDADSRISTSLDRYVVYTVVVGGYDDLAPPAYMPPNCDFVAFSDLPLQVDGWQVLPLNYLHRDPTRASRFVKLHPHLYFPQYTHSIWMDANIGVRGDIGAFFERLSDDACMSAFKHPLRDCVYQEGVECITRRKDNEDVIARHLQRYREREIPEGMGLWETNFLVRRHNDPSCIKLMCNWWKEIETGSRRDQLSLPIAQKAVAAMITPLDTPGVCARRHPLLTFVPHRRKRAVPEPNAVWPQRAPSSSAKPVKATTTIGICIHNGLEVVKNCLISVAAARQEGDSVIVVDDASDPPTASFLERFAAEHHWLRLFRNTENLGYTKSANRIFRAATTDWVVLLNSDTIVPPKGFLKLIEAGEQFPRLAIIGPLSNAAGWQTVPKMTGADGGFLVNRLPRRMTPEHMDELCGEAAPAAAVTFVPLVNGFCFAVRRKVLDQIGYFDEQRFPLGYGEEDDLCLRAIDAGYICGIATNAYVFHTKSASFTSERRKLLSAQGQAMLFEKYGKERLSALTEVMRSHPGLRNLRAELKTLQRLEALRLFRGRAKGKRTLRQPPRSTTPPPVPSRVDIHL